MNIRDLRYALRSLAKSPGFVIIAVLSLGLGLGLTTTMAAMIDAVVHPDLPFRDPDRLFWVQMTGFGIHRDVTPTTMYLRLFQRTSLFEGIAGGTGEGGIVQAGPHSEQRRYSLVTPNYFTVLGLSAKLGRTFMEATARPDENSTVLSYDLWRRMFPDRRSVQGATIIVGDRSYDVIGAVKSWGSTPYLASTFWLLLPPREIASGRAEYVFPIVRLKRGVSRERATAELATLAAELTRQYGARPQPFEYELRPMRRDPVRLKDLHFAMAGAALAVLTRTLPERSSAIGARWAT